MRSIEQIYRHGERWDEINWSQVERDVSRLQGRIYRVSKDMRRRDWISRLEPCAGKHARTVLRGQRVSNNPELLDCGIKSALFRPTPPPSLCSRNPAF